MLRRKLAAALALTLALIQTAAADDRQAKLDKLLAEYEAALTEFYAHDLSADAPASDRVARYQAYPRWEYLPMVLAIAEDKVNDKTTLAACKLVIGETGSLSVGCQWQPLFEAEKKAWQILQNQRLDEEEIVNLCMTASDRQSPAREAFLREMATRTDLPGNASAFATLALANYLAKRFDDAENVEFTAWWRKPEDEYLAFLRTQLADEWIEYMENADAHSVRNEGIALFQRVLNDYADVPVTSMTRRFRGATTLGTPAKQRLYTLEHLVVGALAPDVAGHDLHGNPLRLSDYRGTVVLLSFWYTGCGPCLAALPEERELVDKFRGKPFALLGVCRDSDIAKSQQTAKEHDITWPCWCDGNPGAITDAFNVQSFPTFYLLDAQGRIVAKDLLQGQLAETVSELLEQRKAESASPRADKKDE